MLIPANSARSQPSGQRDFLAQPRTPWLRKIEAFIGFFSLVIVEVNVSRLYQKNMLCSAEWYDRSEPKTKVELMPVRSCGFAVYANASSTACKHCENDVALRLNPKLVGLSDSWPGQCLVVSLSVVLLPIQIVL